MIIIKTKIWGITVCDHDMRFMYVHSGWEGSVNDSRELEEAINDPKHGFPRSPKGIHVLNLNTK